MSGAVLAPVVGKVLTGAIVGRVVGKVTGNDKLGMIAGLAAGTANPLGFGAADTVTAGATGVGTEEVSRTVGNTMIDKAASLPGVSEVGGLLEKGATWAEANPMQAKIAGYGAMGAASMYQDKKAAEATTKAATKQHERNLIEQRKQAELTEASNRNTYDRTHQGFTPRRMTGLLPEQPPVAPGNDYYQSYLNTFSNKGVR